MTRYFLVSSRRPSAGKPIGRGEGVSSRTTNALKPGYRLQRFSRRITRTCMSPLWKIMCAQSLSSTRG